MIPRFLSRAEVDAIHSKMLLDHGGQDGVRNPSGLEAALGMPRQTFGSEWTAGQGRLGVSLRGALSVDLSCILDRRAVLRTRASAGAVTLRERGGWGVPLVAPRIHSILLPHTEASAQLAQMSEKRASGRASAVAAAGMLVP